MNQNVVTLAGRQHTWAWFHTTGRNAVCSAICSKFRPHRKPWRCSLLKICTRVSACHYISSLVAWKYE